MPLIDRHARLAAVALVAASVALAGCDVQVADGDFDIDISAGGLAQDEWSRTYTVAQGGRLEIVNVNGAIRAEASDGPSVEVRTERIARATTDEAARALLEKVEMREEAGADRVRIETRGPSQRGLGRYEVRYFLKVPRGVHVDLRTVNGSVRLAGLAGEITASSTNGAIEGDVAGASRLDARTVNGRVELTLAGPLPDGSRVNLETVNGRVRLGVPDALRADLTARCVNGRIDVSGVELEATGEQSRRRVEGRLNGGGSARLEVGTTNGGIVITKA